MKTLIKSKSEIRPYQVKLQASCVEELLAKRNKIIILASEVGSGKTNMAITITAEILKNDPAAKALFIAHNRKDIRNQGAKRFFSVLSEGNLSLTEADICVVEKMSDYNPKARVVIGIPSTLHKLDLVHYDLLLVDEAHHNTEGKMVKVIIEKIKSKGLKQLYLTATPDKFIDKEGVKIFGFSALDLIKEGRKDGKVYTVLPTTDVAIGYKNVTEKDYDQNTWEILSGLDPKLPRYQTSKVVEVVLQRLAHTRNWPTFGNLLGSLRVPFQATGKTLVFAYSINHAQDLYKEIDSHYPGRVLLSTSENDDTSNNMDSFSNTSHPDYNKSNFLVVVDRATLAWDFPELDNCVDISLGLNPASQKQKYGRLMRPNDGRTKFFLKVTTPDRQNQTDIVMQMMFHLLTPEGLITYKGLGSLRNKAIIIITRHDFTRKPNKKKGLSDNPVVRFKDPMDYWQAMQLDIFEEPELRFKNRHLQTYHTASPNQILAGLEGKRYQNPQGLERSFGLYVKKHGYLPSTGDKDPEVKRMGQLWSHNLNTNSIYSDPAFIQKYKDIPTFAEWKHNRLAEEALNFHKKFNAYPSSCSKDPVERKLGVFVSMIKTGGIVQINDILKKQIIALKSKRDLQREKSKLPLNIHMHKKSFNVKLQRKGKQYNYGCFKTLEEALIVRDKALKEHND